MLHPARPQRGAACPRRRVRGGGVPPSAVARRRSAAAHPCGGGEHDAGRGSWTTLEAHGLYEHAFAAGAVYRAVLRAEVRGRLPSVSWRQIGRGLFEIEGVPDAVMREFSRRRVEIEERAFELTGVAASKLSRERLQGIALQTRKAKEYGVDGARWRQEACARAAEHGLGQRELKRLLSSTAEGGGPIGGRRGALGCGSVVGPRGSDCPPQHVRSPARAGGDRRRVHAGRRRFAA